MRPSSSTSDGGLTGPLFGDPTVSGAVGDEAFVRAMLHAEAALSLAAADAGVAPTAAAAAIASSCDGIEIDIDELGRASVSAGNPVVPLVRMISDVVPDDARPWVHLGATSQDIIDTALMLMSKRAGEAVLAHLRSGSDRCAELAERHRDTVMVGRTLGQQAAPTTFGRKAAGWLVGMDEAADRLKAVCRDRLAVQLGGPVGTLAALAGRGDAVVAAYAERLGLQVPVLGWHTDRQRVLELAGSLGGIAAATAKIANDVVMLAQDEVGEVVLATSGGSSSMPHKQNPVDAILVIAGAARAPGLIATLFAAGAPEHERPAGAWHSEWDPWRELVGIVGGAAARTAGLLGGLQVDADRMRANLDATDGVLMAESVSARLTEVLGRAAAHDLVAGCVDQSVTEHRKFAEVLAENPQVAAVLDHDALRDALDPMCWLGSASAMVDRALAAHRRDRGSA